VIVHPIFLLGSTEANEDDIGLEAADHCVHATQFGEISLETQGWAVGFDGEAGVAPAEEGCREICRAGPAAEKEHFQVGAGSAGAEGFEEVYASHPFFEGTTEEMGREKKRCAVGYDKSSGIVDFTKMAVLIEQNNVLSVGS